METKKSYLPIIALIIGTWCIGWSAIFVKLAAVHGLVSAFYRVLIAAVVILPVWFYRNGKFPSLKNFLLILFGGFLFGMDLVFWNVSIQLSTAATATVLANFAPVWVALGAVFFFKEKLKPIFIVGTMVAILGLFIIIGWRLIIHLQPGKGNLFALTASVFYAGYLLATQKIRNEIDTLTFFTWATVASCITIFIVCQFHHVSFVVPMESWKWLVGLGLVTHVAGWLTINYSLGYIKSSVASVTLLSQAMWTAVFGIFVLHENLTWQQIIGGSVVLLGIYLVNRKS